MLIPVDNHVLLKLPQHNESCEIYEVVALGIQGTDYKTEIRIGDMVILDAYRKDTFVYGGQRLLVTHFSSIELIIRKD